MCLSFVFSPTVAANGPSKQTGQNAILKGKKILLDAGHGRHDPGAVKLGIREKDITLRMVLQLKKVLESRGATVLLTRKDDSVDLELPDISAIIAQVNPDTFISIHVNSSPNNQDTSGIQTYFREDVSRMLGHTMHTVLIQELQAKNMGVFTCQFWVLNNPTVPSLLIETGYITNRPDRKHLLTPAYRERFCQAIADGLEKYLSKKLAGKTE
jgi:N-acetylmuramoyl-L-alanine amidase